MKELLKADIKGQKSKLTNESIKRLRVFKLDDSELNAILEKSYKEQMESKNE